LRSRAESWPLSSGAGSGDGWGGLRRRRTQTVLPAAGKRNDPESPPRTSWQAQQGHAKGRPSCTRARLQRRARSAWAHCHTRNTSGGGQSCEPRRLGVIVELFTLKHICAVRCAVSSQPWWLGRLWEGLVACGPAAAARISCPASAGIRAFRGGKGRRGGVHPIHRNMSQSLRFVINVFCLLMVSGCNRV
jgi:hypothetical protein